MWERPSVTSPADEPSFVVSAAGRSNTLKHHRIGTGFMAEKNHHVPAGKERIAVRRQRPAAVVALSNRPVPKLFGRHILIVEDEMLIALSLGDIVSALGCTSVMASRVAKAVSLAETENFDAAILDLNLSGSLGYPVADALNQRGVPFIIASGYGAEGIPADYAKRPLIPKPYLAEHVEAALLKVLAP